MLVLSAKFTISDMFATPITASHFNLIACASTSQLVKKGDEPWGIVTALLCAGATSVSGTMWEVQLGAGRDFIKAMYQGCPKGGREEVEGGGVVDLAVRLQKTVKMMKRNPNTREPYHWAPFVLHGSWFHR
jgi:CHAT domain-containing protein